MKAKKREAAAEKPPYQPNERERTVLSKYTKRLAAAAPAPRFKLSGGSKTIKLDHPDQVIGGTLLAEALATADVDFANGIIKQLHRVCGRDFNDINFLLAVIKGMKPTDQTETMLLAQMGVIHMATMRFARQLQNVEILQQQDSAERAFNKLARTYISQMEALKRYRTGGEQKVTVQHVSVSEGGQAIVGNVTQTETKTAPEQPANATPALPDARQTPMTMIDNAEGEPVPVRPKKKHVGRSSA
jgi:hypothetical protein